MSRPLTSFRLSPSIFRSLVSFSTSAGKSLAGIALTASVACMAVGCAKKEEPSASKAAAGEVKEAPTPAPSPAIAVAAVCGDLVSRICSELGENQFACGLAKEKLLPLGEGECQKLVPRYDALRDDLKKRQLARSQLSADDMAKLVAGERPHAGNPGAKATLVVFTDFECSACRASAPLLARIVKEYQDRLYVVYRSYPLKKHTYARRAAEAGLAAHAQGKYAEFHHALYAQADPPNDETIVRVAKEIGLDADAIVAALKNGTYAKEIEDDIALGGAVGVLGTPSLVLNGKQVPQFDDYEAIAKQIDAALAI